MNTVPLTPYETWYRDGGLSTYAEVFSHNDEKTVEVEIIVNRLKKSLHWPSDKTLAILDIGCGTGRFTVMLLDQLCTSVGLGCTSNVDLVDINSGAFDRFRTTTTNAQSAKISVRQTITAPWRLINVNNLHPPYHLIVADHVFYGEPLTTTLLDRLTGLTIPEGIIVVTLQTADSDVFRMRDLAGIVNNGAEDFAALLEHCGAKFETLDYESRLYFELTDHIFKDWFFATTKVKTDEQQRLLRAYTLRDEIGRTYLSNRANIFLIWGVQKDDIGG